MQIPHVIRIENSTRNRNGRRYYLYLEFKEPVEGPQMQNMVKTLQDSSLVEHKKWEYENFIRVHVKAYLLYPDKKRLIIVLAPEQWEKFHIDILKEQVKKACENCT